MVKKHSTDLTPFPKSAGTNQTNGQNSKPVVTQLPSVWRLGRSSLSVLWANRKLFLGMAGLHALLSLFFVQSTAGSLNISGLRTLLDGSSDRLLNGVLTYQWIVSGSGNSATTLAGVYDFILVLLFSLAIIWALRQVINGNAIRLRDAFYKGMYPLVPVLAVLVVVLIKLIPLIIGLGVFNLVLAYGYADSAVAKLLWGLPALGLVVLSLILVVPSVMSLYIATLADMEPAEALRSGRELVRYRRWTVLRKLIFMPLVVVAVGFCLMLPILLFLPLVAPWIVFVYGILVLPVMHSYYYHLYRELLV